MDSVKNISQTRQLVKHGLIVLLIGLLCGFGLAFSINGFVGFPPIPITWEYTMDAPPRAWRSAHVGAIANGLMAILIAAVLPYFDLAKSALRKVVGGLIVVIWGNTIFYIASLWAPNRGLSVTDTQAGPGNLAGIIAYIPAIVAAVILIWTVIYLILVMPRKTEL